MQPSPEFAAQLAELGWAVLFILLVLVIAFGLWRRWWAPGWVLASLEKQIASLEQENSAWRRLYLDVLTGAGKGERDPFGGGPPSVGHL